MGINDDRVYVTYPGSTINPKLTKNFEINSDKPYFIHVGGTRRNKNIERLIDAYQTSSVQAKADLFIV